MENITAAADMEKKRVQVLREYDLLDTPPESSFDRLTSLAAHLLDMPLAFVSFVDTDRIWFKSRFGTEEVTQLEREPGFCASAMDAEGLYVVGDALTDPRTMKHPMVYGPFGLRFYAAVPLKARGGYGLGAFSVMDKKPRELTVNQKETLFTLAAALMDYIELRSVAQKARARQNELYHVIAHDLRNPLTIISLETELMKMDPDTSEETAEMCDQISNAGKKMATIIDDMLQKNKEQQAPSGQ